MTNRQTLGQHTMTGNRNRTECDKYQCIKFGLSCLIDLFCLKMKTKPFCFLCRPEKGMSDTCCVSHFCGSTECCWCFCTRVCYIATLLASLSVLFSFNHHVCFILKTCFNVKQWLALKKSLKLDSKVTKDLEKLLLFYYYSGILG